MKITHKQLRDLIRDGMVNEAGSQYPPPIDDKTSYEDTMNADQLSAIGADYDVDGNPLPANDGAPEDAGVNDTDADNDGVPDALEEDFTNLVANAAERLSMEQIVEIMLNALSDETHGGFPMQDVISSVEKWSSSAAGDYNDMNESNIIKRWEDLAGLLKN